MIKEGDYILVTDIEDKNYLKVGIVIETKYDVEGIMCACIIGFGYDQETNKKKYETYIGKSVHKKFKILVLKE